MLWRHAIVHRIFSDRRETLGKHSETLVVIPNHSTGLNLYIYLYSIIVRDSICTQNICFSSHSTFCTAANSSEWENRKINFILWMEKCSWESEEIRWFIEYFALLVVGFSGTSTIATARYMYIVRIRSIVHQQTGQYGMETHTFQIEHIHASHRNIEITIENCVLLFAGGYRKPQISSARVLNDWFLFSISSSSKNEPRLIASQFPVIVDRK